MEKQYKAGMKSLSTFTKYRIGCDNGEDNIFGKATLQIDKRLHFPLYYHKPKRIVIWR